MPSFVVENKIQVQDSFRKFSALMVCAACDCIKTTILKMYLLLDMVIFQPAILAFGDIFIEVSKNSGNLGILLRDNAG